MERILPCPFCGEKAEIHAVDRREGFTAYFIGCDGKYGIICPGNAWKMTPLFFAEDGAIRAWNRRNGENAGGAADYD